MDHVKVISPESGSSYSKSKFVPIAPIRVTKGPEAGVIPEKNRNLLSGTEIELVSDPFTKRNISPGIVAAVLPDGRVRTTVVTVAHAPHVSVISLYSRRRTRTDVLVAAGWKAY
jgi:hypothetical protein